MFNGGLIKFWRYPGEAFLRKGYLSWDLKDNENLGRSMEWEEWLRAREQHVHKDDEAKRSLAVKEWKEANVSVQSTRGWRRGRCGSPTSSESMGDCDQIQLVLLKNHSSSYLDSEQASVDAGMPVRRWFRWPRWEVRAAWSKVETVKMGRSGRMWVPFQRLDRTWWWTGYKGIMGRADSDSQFETLGIQHCFEVAPFKNQATLEGWSGSGI